jgi:hypothetical protein
MGDQDATEATKVDLGQGSHEETQGGSEPAKDKNQDEDEDHAPPIAPRPGR